MSDKETLANQLEDLAKKATPRPWDLRIYQSGTVALVMREWPAPNEYGSGFLSAHMTAFNIGEQDEAAIDREKFINADLLRTLVNNLPTILSALRASTQGGEDSSLSTKPTAGEGWRTDVENMPKDGRAFHVWAPGFDWPEAVRWENYEEGFGPDDGTEGYWTYAETLLAEVTDSCGSEEWTHWREINLPPAPAAPAKGEDA